MERLLIFKNDNAITARMVDYKHTEQRINAAISAVIDTGLKLADFDLSRIADKDFICSEAQRQAIQNAQAHTPYPITAEHVDTRTWREQLTEICTQLTKEMRSLKVRLDYFTFSDGRATLDREKLQADLAEANSIFAETEEQAEAWRLAQEAKEKLDAYLSFVSKHDVGAPFNFSPVVDADAWGKCGLIMLHKDKAEIDPKALCYIK